MLADAAQNADGKLYVLGGGWDVINTAQFPLQLPQVSLVVKLVIPWNEANRQHEFRVDLDDEDGGAVLPQPRSSARSRWPDRRPVWPATISIP